MLSDKPFTKDDLNLYLKELAKEFRKRQGKTMPVEIVLIGGASVIINYGFREMTYDIDAITSAAASMKDSVNFVGDKYNLPNGWINSDFMSTPSYSPKIMQYSTYYRTFSNIVTIRTVTGEYLLAMKLMAGRQYKFDLSDVIGVLWEQEKKKSPISLENVKIAAENLYGSYEALPESSRLFIERAITDGNYETIYKRVRQTETENKDILLDFQEAYPGVTNADNDDIFHLMRIFCSRTGHIGECLRSLCRKFTKPCDLFYLAVYSYIDLIRLRKKFFSGHTPTSFLSLLIRTSGSISVSTPNHCELKNFSTSRLLLRAVSFSG